MPTCKDINKDNYTKYHDRYYFTDSKQKGSCIDSSGKFQNGGSANCNEADYACYANYNLTEKRNKLDADLADIYQPQYSTSATFDSNYQTTMLTGLVWAMLGTTVIYYAFTKI